MISIRLLERDVWMKIRDTLHPRKLSPIIHKGFHDLAECWSDVQRTQNYSKIASL